VSEVAPSSISLTISKDTGSTTRKEDAFKRQVQTPDRKLISRILIAIIAVVLFIFAITAAEVVANRLRYYNTSFLLQACEYQTIAFGLLSDWRHYNLGNRFNATDINLKASITDVRSRLDTYTSTILSLTQQNGERQRVFIQETYPVQIPLLIATDPNNSTNSNMTLFDISMFNNKLIHSFSHDNYKNT
jgi:hypothetical protein